MTFFLIFQSLVSCATVEAQETPLPEGAAGLRDSARTFHTFRAWVSGGSDASDWLGRNPPFSPEFILTVREDGVAVVDPAGQNERFRWSSESVQRDSSTVNFRHPLERHLETLPRAATPWNFTIPLVQTAISAVRSPDTAWLPQGPSHYGWGLGRGNQVEIVPANADLGDYHVFLTFDRNRLPTRFEARKGRSGGLILRVERLEINPPLPTTWFDADAPDFDTSFPLFDEGEPVTPLDPGFYAPAGEPPPPL
jgi:hypothetical protein